MAKVVDVTDVPEMPGAGMLHFDDGRPPLMALPEIAHDYRSQLGKTDQRLAANDVPKGETRTDATGHGASGSWDDAPEPSAPAPAAAPPTPSPAQSGAEGPPPGVAAPPPDPTTQDLTAQAVDATRRQAASELLYGKQTAPTAGHAAGYVPTTQKVTTEAGAPYDPAMAAQRIDADHAVLDAKLSQIAAVKQTADAQAAHAGAATAQYQQQQATLQAEMNRKQQVFQQQRQHLENELQSYSESAKPDPNRFFASRGPIGSIMMVLGQAIGAGAATLTHSPNFAQEYIQGQIRNDIEAQKVAYEAGMHGRETALGRFVNYYHGDMDMAQNALNIAMNKVVSTEATQFGAQAQSRDAASQAQVIAAQMQADSLNREQKMYQDSIGKTTTAADTKFQAAQAASGGGRKPLTDAQRAAALKIAAGDKVKDQGALGLSPQALARQKAAYSTKVESLASFADSLSHRATLMGIHFNPKTGDLTNGKGKQAQEADLDVPYGAGVVGKHLSSDALTPKAMELRRAEENSVRLHAAAVYNHSISAEEGAAEVDHTIGSTDVAKLANMRYLAEEYRKRKLAIDTGAASIDPRMVNGRDEAEAAVNYSRATGKPLPGPAPTPGAGNASDGPADEAEGNEPQ